MPLAMEQKDCGTSIARVKRVMRFLRRNQYLLLFAAMLVFSAVMVIRQFVINQSTHIELREDFILLCERNEMKASQRLYDQLMRELPSLSEPSLVTDLQRAAMLVDPKTPAPENLLWKYYAAVKSEMEKRSEQRLKHALQHAEQN